MKIITIFCARNEMDILEACTRHCAQWSSNVDMGDATWIPWDGEHNTEPPVRDSVPCNFNIRYPVREVSALEVLAHGLAKDTPSTIRAPC